MSSEFAPSQTREPEGLVRLGRLSYDPATNMLVDGDSLVQIAPKTCELLSVFLCNQGRLLSKSEIMDLVWPDTFVEESNLTHHIAALRKALDGQALIETVPRRGYRFSIANEATESVIVQRIERRVVEIEEVVEERPGKSLNFKGAAAACAVIGGLFLAAVVGYSIRSGSFVGKGTSMTTALSVAGQIRSFAVSPDGKMIAFAWRPEGEKASQLYVQLSGGGTPLKLTNSGSSVFPAWSPDSSTIAFIRSDKTTSSIVFVPALGGPERKFCDLVDVAPLDLAWSADGNLFAVSDTSGAENGPRSIVLIKASDGSKTRLTHPPAESNGDFLPTFSPDSRSVVFRRDAAVASDIRRIEIDRSGELILSSESVLVQSLAWTVPDTVIYTAKRGSASELFRVSAKIESKPEKLQNLGTQATRISTSRDSGNLYFLENLSDVNIWETSFDPELENVVERKKIIGGPRIEENGELSPDGRRIAFISDRSGFYEIWLAATDGTEETKLTDLAGPVIGALKWSPDGSQLSMHASFGRDQDIYVVNAASGKATRITEGGKHYVRNWSLDGKSVYYTTLIDDRWQFAKKLATGGSEIVIEADGANKGFELNDGSIVYCKMDSGGISLKRTDGTVEEIVNETDFLGLARSSDIWPLDNGFVYSNDEAGIPKYTLLELKTGERRTLLSGVQQPRIGLSISKDGRRWFANRTDYSSAEVIRIDGLSL